MDTYPTKKIIRFLYSKANPTQRTTFWLLCLLNIFISFSEMGIAGGVSLLGIAMSSPDTLLSIELFNKIEQYIFTDEYISRPLSTIMLIFVAIFIGTILKNILLAYNTKKQNFLAHSIGWDISSYLFIKYLNAPFIWHTKKNSSDMIVALNFREYVDRFIVSLFILITQGIIVIFLLCGSILLAAKASLFLFATTALVTGIVQKYTKHKIYKLSQAVIDYRMHNSRVAMQGLHGIREVIIYDRKKNFSAEYDRHILDYVRDSSRLAVFPYLPQWILEATGLGLLLTIMTYQVYTGSGIAEVTGTFMLLAAVSWRLLPAMNKISSAMLALRRDTAGVEKLLEHIEQAAVFALPEQRRLHIFKKSIELEHISFTYPQNSRPALDDISLSIPHKKIIGIVGPSGSGKSTLAGVVAGLLQADSGNIAVDGHPLNPTRERLAVGYVPQSLYLLDASLEENVAFSRWREPADAARAHECCQMAAMNFVDDLPEGIHTVLGERGVRLSGGQVQRVGIARALYSDPELLIFDEATSALDGATEKEIMGTISSLRGSVSILLIAHRLSTVEICDTIYRIEQGRIVDSGCPQIVLPRYEQALREWAGPPQDAPA